MKDATTRQRGITIIAIVNAFGAILTVAFWALVFVRVFAAADPPAQLFFRWAGWEGEGLDR